MARKTSSLMCYSGGYTAGRAVNSDDVALAELLAELTKRVEALEQKFPADEVVPEVNAVRGNSRFMLRMSPMVKPP